jgi:hypothetical protein
MAKEDLHDFLSSVGLIKNGGGEYYFSFTIDGCCDVAYSLEFRVRIE